MRSFSWRPLVALCIGWFIVVVDATIVNVALPAMARDLGASVSGLQWVLDGYTVVFAGLLLSGGWLADRVGARRVYTWGFVAFCGASVGCALAGTFGVLVAARVVQGLGAALLVPACLRLIQASYPDRAARTRAIGLWAAVGGIAGGSGPLLGGVLTEAIGWRALFWVNVPLGVVGLILTRLWVTTGTVDEQDRPGFDWLGQLTAGVALLACTAGVVEAGRRADFWGVPVSLIAVGILAAIAFVVVERRSTTPMLPPSLFADRGLSGALAVGFVMNFSFYGILFVEALLLERVYGFTPLRAGLALLPQTGLIALGSWFAGRVTGRVGPRMPMAVGMAVGALGYATLTVTGSHTPYLALVPSMLAIGFGIAFSMPAATSAVVEGAPPERGGIASGALNASRQVGGALGIALLGSFVAGTGAIVPGARIALVLAALAYGGGLAVALRSV